MDTRARGRPWLLMAVLAVLSLGATVFVAQRALGDAQDVVVRGEADVVMAAVVSELREETTPPSNVVLERALKSHEAEGLRYVAIVDREGRAIAEAGTATVEGHPGGPPGHAMVRGPRVRLAGPLFPPRRPMHGTSGRDGRMGPPPMALLVVELEPPVMARLRAHLTHIAIVASVAGATLLAFALAWSRSAGRLDAALAKAAREQRLVALGSMSSVMAHELKNPLASLKGHAQLLAEDLENDPKKKAKADRVVAEALRLEVLTSSLLDFVRDGPIERTSVSPAALLDRALADLPRERVVVDLANAPADVFVDPTRLSRAVHNLVENALQADSSGSVDVTMRADGDDMVIDVCDRGPGLPPTSDPARAAMFEPFVTTRTKGTGLGLAVARRIAEQHGGTLTGEDRAGGGAVFRLRWRRDA